jgi:hypothetical protein
VGSRTEQNRGSTTERGWGLLSPYILAAPKFRTALHLCHWALWFFEFMCTYSQGRACRQSKINWISFDKEN